MTSFERRGRAAVVLRDGPRVALIRRVREGRTYFVFPGGGIRSGETPAEAATREAQEELGVRVVLGPRLLIDEFRGETVHYFSGLIVDGEFGTGTGDELLESGTTSRGSYEPVWMETAELLHHDVRPRVLAAILAGGWPGVANGREIQYVWDKWIIPSGCRPRTTRPTTSSSSASRSVCGHSAMNCVTRSSSGFGNTRARSAS